MSHIENKDYIYAWAYSYYLLYKYFKTGHLIKIKPRKKGYKPQLRWQTTHRQSYQVLKKLIPYMIHKEKIKKAKEVFKFYE